eukprot:1788361-Amphidinium_carterae.1
MEISKFEEFLASKLGPTSSTHRNTKAEEEEDIDGSQDRSQQVSPLFAQVLSMWKFVSIQYVIPIL